jgi:hypothetical protein
VTMPCLLTCCFEKRESGHGIARDPGEDQAEDYHCEYGQGDCEPQTAKNAAALNGIRSLRGRVGCHKSIFTG